MEDELEQELLYVRELMYEHKRRLHGLEVRAAKSGIHVDSAIETEIADIKMKLEKLHQKKDILQQIEVSNYQIKKLIDQARSCAQKMQDMLLSHADDWVTNEDIYAQLVSLVQDADNHARHAGECVIELAALNKELRTFDNT